MLCANCKHFQQPTHDAYGQCKLASSDNGEPDTPGAFAYASDAESYAARLNVLPTFGCNQFAQMVEVEPEPVTLDYQHVQALFDAGKHEETINYLRDILTRDKSGKLVHSEAWKKVASGPIGKYITDFKNGKDTCPFLP